MTNLLTLLVRFPFFISVGYFCNGSLYQLKVQKNNLYFEFLTRAKLRLNLPTPCFIRGYVCYCHTLKFKIIFKIYFSNLLLCLLEEMSVVVINRI